MRLFTLTLMAAVSLATAASASKPPNPNVNIIDYEITASDFVGANPSQGPVDLDFQVSFGYELTNTAITGLVTNYSLPYNGVEFGLLPVGVGTFYSGCERSCYAGDAALDLFVASPVPSSSPRTYHFLFADPLRVFCCGVSSAPHFFLGTDYSGFGGSVAQNVSVSSQVIQLAVPEPATWTLMLLGFGSLGFALRARRHAARLIGSTSA